MLKYVLMRSREFDGGDEVTIKAKHVGIPDEPFMQLNYNTAPGQRPLFGAPFAAHGVRPGARETFEGRGESFLKGC